MTSKKPAIRPLGQRSIASTFLFRSSNGSASSKFHDAGKNIEIKGSNEKGSSLSLSDFLNKKLHRSSVLPSSVQEKQKPFSSPLSNEDVKGHGVRESGRDDVADAHCSLDGVFELFKHKEMSQEADGASNASSNIERPISDDIQQTRKRKYPTEGDDAKPSAQKVLAVLGEDSKPKQRRKRKNPAKIEEQPPLYNHYANGAGWWDCFMEGVDSEEVGCNEVWEGVGSTTLGGIEWH